MRSILELAGFESVTITPFDSLIGGGDIERTLSLALKVGSPGAALRENPQLQGAVAEVVRTALQPYATPAGVMKSAAVWIVLARNRNVRG